MNITGVSLRDDGDLQPNTPDIELPNQTEYLSRIAVDIGGSLVKVVYFSRESTSTSKGGRLKFVKFETENIDECIDFIANLLTTRRQDKDQKDVIKATGGGSYKYYDIFVQKLGNVTIEKEDEMNCLIAGMNFLVAAIPYETFTYTESNQMCFEESSNTRFPYMLVNIGSGVSILKVSAPNEFERISGTPLGGGTLWGLLSLLTGAKTYDEMLEMCKNGDNKNVDMLVGDIYGTDYSKIGLDSTMIASSFGKAFKKNSRESVSLSDFRPEDICRSILLMISNNISQIAFLNAKVHGLNRIYFGGNFIRGHTIIMSTLSVALDFWSNGTMKAFFLRHEGYLGALGAFLKSEEVQPN